MTYSLLMNVFWTNCEIDIVPPVLGTKIKQFSFRQFYQTCRSTKDQLSNFGLIEKKWIGLVFFCFVHTIFRFWFLVSFGNKVTKILCDLCLHFARQYGQDRKKWNEKDAFKVTKIPKPQRRKYGMNETFKL